MSARHIVAWPAVRVTVDGKRVNVAHGELVPEGVSAVDLDNLVSFGAIVGTSSVLAAEDGDTDGKPETDAAIKKITKYVGDDKALAQEYLDAEQAKGADARGSLVEALQKVLAAEA